MDCKKTEKYLFLKSNELTPQQKEELNQHLMLCEKCKETISASLEFHKSIARLKEHEPVLLNPHLFTSQILDKVNGKGLKSNLLQYLINSFDNWFAFPAIKPTLVAVSVCLILLFSYQQATDQYEINSLEMKMKKYSFKPGLTSYKTLKFNDFQMADSSLSQKSKWFRTLFSTNQKVNYAAFSFPHFNKYYLTKSDSSSTQKIFRNFLLIKGKSKIEISGDSANNSIKK